jgi:UDP-N-acetylglucosamine/UDP-N-acetylgalactosamine diphosphorylase
MSTVPPDLRQRLDRHGQSHVLAHWKKLTETQQRGLLAQLAAIDLDELAALYARRDEKAAPPAWDKVRTPELVRPASPDDAEARALGETALRHGEVAVLIVAGGQGSRLGFEKPKGMYPVGPVSRKSLFQVHAEKVLALRRRYGAPVPFLVMTSPATHDETEAYFDQHGFFGLPETEVFFFCQGTMPALDLATGKLLLAKPHELFLSPDGHGGTITALADSGLLDRMRSRGIKHFFYFQVDNPLVKVADPVFLGHHIKRGSLASTKIVTKVAPMEPMGVVVEIDDRCSVIEYTEMTPDVAPRYLAGNTAIHIFNADFLALVSQGAGRIPFHVAKKKVPHLDASGQEVCPKENNALKFERFIFDVLPQAERSLVAETVRAEEFAPLKNATGADSPETVERALHELFTDWLERAGAVVVRGPDLKVEISPLVALDAHELAAKVEPGRRIEGEVYLS